MNAGAANLSAVESKRIAIPALLVIPTLLLMAITITGYLYFTQQQIRSSLIDDEYHHVTRMAQILSERISESHHDAVTIVRDIANERYTSSGEPNTDAIASRVMQLFAKNNLYETATFIAADGTELLRIERIDGEPRFVAADRLMTDSSWLLAKASAALARQPLASIFQLLLNERGYVVPHTPVLSTLMEDSAGDLLATSMRVDALLAELNSEVSQSAGEFWLVNSLGDWVASSDAGNDFAFRLDGSLQNAVRGDYPEAWAIINSRTSGTAPVHGGQLAFTEVCARLNCTRGSDASADLPGSGWRLVSYLPEPQLLAWNLLAAEPNRWLPMLGLLVVVSLISAVGAWFIGSMIVAQRRNEGRLQQASLLQHSFFEKNPEIMFVKNLDGTYYFANEMCRRLAGQPEADFSGRSNIDLFTEEAANSMSLQDRQIIESEEAMEFHSHWERDGDMAYFKTLRFPIYDKKHQLIAVGGIANDVTEQVHSRHALLENEKLLRTFIESAPDAVLVSDVEGRVSLVNKQAELIFAFDRQEMLKRSLFDLISGLTAVQIQDALQFANDKKGEIFREVIQSTGCGNNSRSFPVEFSLAPVTTDEGALIICLLRDTSEKAFMETQLRQSQKMEAVGKLTGGMAHDFNNLLGIIIGNVTLALKQLPENNEQLEKRLSTVMKAADRGAELTKRMLAIARRQPLQPKPVIINDVVQELSSMLPQTLGSDIEMGLQLAPQLPAILVDESGFEAMLLNLAINSRDAMPQGGTFSICTGKADASAVQDVLPNTRVQSGDYVHIAVSDSGEGMSEEALEKAFEPFFTTKEKDKGTGLGLAMIYGFVKQSKGFVVLDSEKGVGTTVHIYLPVMDEEDAAEGEGPQSDDAEGISGEGRVILLVDDETELLKIAEAYLSDLGFEVHCATCGKEALELMDKLPRIDLLLTDVVMPGGINGVALAREVTDRDSSIAVLYASGFPTGVIEENSKVVLDAPLLHKPYSLKALSRAMRDVLGQCKNEN